MSSSPLGLQRGKVRLDSHNPEWQRLFQQEKSDFKEALGDKFIAAEHVGSTAIPGIKAKPILDEMLAIPDLEHWEWVAQPLAKLGYEFRRDYRKEQQHLLFVKGPEANRTHYLKVTELDSDFWTEHVLFRDYLNNHPHARNEYAKLKNKLLDEHTGNREPYTQGKAAFIAKTLRAAGFRREIL